MRLRSVVAALLGCSLLWAAPTPLSADDATCSYNPGTRIVTVGVVDTDDAVSHLFIDSGGGIHADAQACGMGTVTNTDTIVLNDTTPGTGGVFIYLVGGPWGPGFTNEPGSSDEIEFEVNFGTNPKFHGDVLGLDLFQTPATPHHVAFGANQINLNAEETDGIDADLVLSGVEGVIAFGADLGDVFDGSGGTGTPDTPTPLRLDISSLGGNDLVIGGANVDGLNGQLGNDIVLGGGNFDEVSGGDGDDVVDGGRGLDGVRGDPGDDVIRGGPGRDFMKGGSGDDAMKGQAGRDKLSGHAGKDALNGGPNDDRCIGGPGKDSFTSCESQEP